MISRFAMLRDAQRDARNCFPQRLVAGAAALCLLAPAIAFAELGPSAGGDITVRLFTVASWQAPFSGPNQEIAPSDLVPFNDGTGRLMVATLGGTIRVIDGGGILLGSPLLTTGQTGSQIQQEAGMTGLTLHPDFSSVGSFGYGKLYTITTENDEDAGGLQDVDVDFIDTDEAHQDVIREWDLSTLVGNPAVNSLPAMTLADSREILRVDQPGSFHNLVDLTFNTHAQPGEDDYGQLYISAGDGGANDPFGSSRQATAQKLNTIYGKMLRINPDPTAHDLVRINQHSGLPSYSIAPTNPYNGDDGTESTNRPGSGDTNDTLAEIWSNGLRSPYRISFDRATGVLYVGDVGENGREEVSVIAASKTNSGWGRFEGSATASTSIALTAGTTHTPPLFEYLRTMERRTVVGGFVYRGSALPELQGKYIFADFGNGNAAGILYYGIIDPLDPDFGEFFELQIDPFGPQYPSETGGTRLMPDQIVSIGEDENGELYLVAGEDLRHQSDPSSFIIKLGPIPGPDTDFDGMDGATLLDFEILRANYLIAGATHSQGDANFDGHVNHLDFFLWRADFLAGGGSLEQINFHVPEPATAALLLIAAPFNGRRRRRR
jgi:glucose/arabinose dehydrogenase